MTENEDWKQKKLVRGGHRAYAPKILGQAKGLLVDYKDDSDATLLQYKATLEKRVKILEQLDEEIFGLTKAEEINAAIEEPGTFVEGITEILIRLDKTISLASNENSKSKNEHLTIVVSETSLPKMGSHAELPNPGGTLQLKIRGAGSIVWGLRFWLEKIFWGSSKILTWTIVRG